MEKTWFQIAAFSLSTIENKTVSNRTFKVNGAAEADKHYRIEHDIESLKIKTTKS